MKKEATQKYFIYNGKVLPTEQFSPTGTSNTPTIYEVIRVINGVPLFFEEHMERFKKSAQLLGGKLPYSFAEFHSQIKKLIEVNQCQNINIKITVAGLQQPQQETSVFFIESHYPEAKLYQQGVHTILVHEERENPNAKLLNTSFKERINILLKEAQAYEALLVNHKGEITEGSRSNLFLVKGSTVYTPPKESVLVGITREHICKVCEELKIEVIEEPILLKDLPEFGGLFISGTSPKVLPISSVGDISFASVKNPVIQSIREGYDKIIDDYIFSRVK